ncbi:MAG: aquaporin [Nitrososphaera sp.]
MKNDKRLCLVEHGGKSFGGITIGAVIPVDTIVGMNVSGGSVNPARSFGPALVFGDFADNWIYWIAPVIGALIAFWVFKSIETSKFYDKSTKNHFNLS